VILAAPLDAPNLFRAGTTLIGFGGGLFAVGTLTAAMNIELAGATGLALGAWGAIQATAAGVAIALGGAVRDIVGGLATQGTLGTTLNTSAVGYGVVYQIELLLLFMTLVAIGPLVRHRAETRTSRSPTFGLAEFPG
jgi:BCD family chlorophyll transporter-like MFS transporter